MSRAGLAIVIAIAATTALAGCGRKRIEGVLEGGSHVPPPPSEQHRVTSRVPTIPTSHAVEAPAHLRAPAN